MEESIKAQASNSGEKETQEDSFQNLDQTKLLIENPKFPQPWPIPKSIQR